jgi:acyl CoA:acetate/3-ketoacid CoA transferase beta subunit
MSDWSIDELMIIEMAKLIRADDVIHCGAYTPLVLASALLAKATHAPDCVILPISVSCARTDKVFPMTLTLLEAMGLGDSIFYTMSDIFHHVEGYQGCDFEPISPVQIDRYGNFNITVIGSYDRPKVRLPGAAGMDILPIMPANKLVIYAPRHTTKVFVPKVDFITGAGHLDGPGGRERAGITGAGGPSLVITNLGILDFHPDTKQMRLLRTHPGVTVDKVKENTGFPLLVADRVEVTDEPPAELVRLLRETIDPYGIRRFEFITAKERLEQLGDLLNREERDFLGPQAA